MGIRYQQIRLKGKKSPDKCFSRLPLFLSLLKHKINDDECQQYHASGKGGTGIGNNNAGADKQIGSNKNQGQERI